MIKRTLRLLNNSQYKKLISNFSYLTVINIVNRILPLIVVPYIVRTIGVEKFGVVTFAWAFASYGILITKYSFELTAVKHISLHKRNVEELSRYLWTVLSTRFVLTVLVFIVYVVLVFSVEKFYAEREVMLYTFIAVLADAMMPIYFFRGIEEMKYIAIFSIFSKLLYAAGVFVFVHAPEDYVYIPLLNGISLFTVGIYVLYYIHKKYTLRLIRPKITEMYLLLKEGKDIFWSNMSVSFYTTINPVLLGLFGSYSAVGIYSLAEAIYNAYSSIIKSYTVVVYPHLAQYIDDLQQLYRQARKFFRAYVMILVAASALLYLMSDFIITLLYGSGHDTSIEILKILAIATLLEPLGGFFTASLALKSQYRVIRSITFRTMLVNLLLIIPAIYLYGAKGLAYLFLLLSILQVYLNLSKNHEILRNSSKTRRAE